MANNHLSRIVGESHFSTDDARGLPSIRQLANCAICTPECEIVTSGYHPFNGGTPISTRERPPEVELEAAVAAIRGLLEDFEFVSPSDKSRAVASLISPAFNIGGHIADDFPIDVAEADQSQSGKTYRQGIDAKLYNETPTACFSQRAGWKVSTKQSQPLSSPGVHLCHSKISAAG